MLWSNSRDKILEEIELVKSIKNQLSNFDVSYLFIYLFIVIVNFDHFFIFIFFEIILAPKR